MPLFRATAVPAAWGEGFYWDEVDGDGMAFRWMQREARLDFDVAQAERYLELQTYSNFHDLSQELEVAADGEPALFPLVRGWQRLSIAVPAGIARVRLGANRSYPPELHPGDGRDLALQIRHPHLHGDAARHALVTAQHANARLNVGELLTGAEHLSSTPRMIGIDLYGGCNIKPPCVYCAWQSSKALEGDQVRVPFDAGGLGEFLERATRLVNCSIGEPFLMRNLPELLGAFDVGAKTLEMASNGQVLTDAQLESLVGRDVELYVSLDAATAATYARLRNDRFARILPNIRKLVEAKGGKGPEHPPLVDLVFMPMRANQHEAEAFAQLCAELGTDRVVLRPLNVSVAEALVTDRGGYHYDYNRELLRLEEQVRLAGRLDERCRRLGVRFANQLDFGGPLTGRLAEIFEEGRREVAVSSPAPAPSPAATAASQAAIAAPEVAPTAPAGPEAAPAPPPSLGAEKVPVCLEPWSSLYALRRGIMPCCYGGAPIAPAGDFREAWNAPVLQAIRRELTAGRFHRYCLDSPDCPIVKKHAHAAAPSTPAPEGPAAPTPRPSFLARAWHRLRVVG